MLFSYRDHITDLETLTRDLQIRLKGNFEEDPRYLSSAFYRGDEPNHENAEKSVHATPHVLRGLLNEAERHFKTSSTSSDNDLSKIRKNIDIENDRRCTVDGHNMQPIDKSNEIERQPGIYEDSHETSFSQITHENGETESDGDEVIEKMELTKCTLDSDGNDRAFDSFDDVFNYEKKGENSESIHSLVVDDIQEIYSRSQSDNGIPADEDRFSHRKSLSVDDESVDSFKIIKDTPFTGNSKQVVLEEQERTESRAVTHDEEQSPFSNLQTFANERTDDFPESKTEQSIASKTPIYYVSSNNEDSDNSAKILETLEDSALLTRGFLKDSSAHDEDNTTKQSMRHSGSEEYPSQRYCIYFMLNIWDNIVVLIYSFQYSKSMD